MPATIIHKRERPDRLADDLEILRLAGCGIREKEIRSISRQYARMAKALDALVVEVESADAELVSMPEAVKALRRFR